MNRHSWLCVVTTVVVGLLSAGRSADAADEGATDARRFITRVRALTYEGRRAGEAYFSPDGRELIFQSERDPENPFYQIFTLSFETGEIRRVSPGVGKTTCSFFHPSDDRVLFASTHLDRNARRKQKAELEFRASGKTRRYSWDYDTSFDIFSSRRDGSRLKRLTRSDGYDAEASYSPDGREIVFSSLRQAYPSRRLSADDRKRLEIEPSYFGEIYAMRADGSHVRRLTDWPGYDGGPFFSPDGERIVWRHFEEGGMLADVYTMRRDGSDRRRITDFGSMCWAPFYHPSGRYIIFTSNKLGFSNFELYIVDTDGEKNPVRVTTTDRFDGLPAFSPDGRRLAWTSNRDGDVSRIFIAEWNHEAALEALAASPAREGRAHSFDAAIRARDLEADVAYIASDALHGRMTGSAGERLAIEYFTKRFESLGVRGLDGDGYLQEFPFTAGVTIKTEENSLDVAGPNGAAEAISFKVNKDFRPLAFTSNETAEGDVAFAGYGLSVPGESEHAYDSYAGVDVKDKIVIVLRYAPENVPMERRQELNRYAGLRYKAMIARDHGARALLVVTGPNSPNAGELVSLKFDQSLASSRIVVASVSGRVADEMFRAAGKNLEEVQSALDAENPHAEGAFVLEGVKLRIRTAVEKETRHGHNVIGVLPPASGGGHAEYVLVGAHFDHLGHGEVGSLGHKGEEGMIHNGADDNASGTAVILELAAALAQSREEHPERFKRGVILSLWSGEELGVIGSAYFAEHPSVPLENIVACLNFDMVGRMRDNKLILQGVGSSAGWRRKVERRNVAAGFSLVLQEDPYLPTDVTAFYSRNVPVLSFFTGSHEDYHRPTDDVSKVNFDDLERVARFAQALVVDLMSDADRPAWARVERTAAPPGQREELRAYLGTIPDYASSSDVVGVLLTGVRAGGPADKAGLMGGDVIVEFGGRKITNIYDYTYALDAVKIGRAVEVVVLRNNEHIKLTVVPEARN